VLAEREKPISNFSEKWRFCYVLLWASRRTSFAVVVPEPLNKAVDAFLYRR
jgi:hypothetical protein